MRLEKYYDDKARFVKDFIEFCRESKKSHRGENESIKYIITKRVSIYNENWIFCIIVNSKHVWTQAELLIFDYSNPKRPVDKSVTYPLTQWGSQYIRWDMELREFLNREVNKR